jgi:hypothetical protein
MAAYRLVVVNGSRVVAEARVLPEEQGPRQPGAGAGGRRRCLPAGSPARSCAGSG